MAGISRTLTHAFYRNFRPHSWCHFATNQGNIPQLMDISGKVALITGGTSGLGVAIAEELLGQNAKAVVVSGIDTAEGEKVCTELNELHGKDKCTFMELDVIKMQPFEAVVQKVQKDFGSIDILVNNAAVMQDKKWEEEIDINVKGVVHGVLIADRNMHQNNPKGGVVLNIGDVYGLDPHPFAPIYSGSKHCVVGLTKSFGHPENFAKSNVRIATICPGAIKPGMAMGEMLKKEWTKQLCQMIHSAPSQCGTSVAQAAVYVIKYGEPGSIWPMERGVLYKAIIPELKIMKKKELDV